MDLNIRDRVVFIAGGAGDIGESILKAFAQQHAKVIIGDVNEKKAGEIAKGSGELEVSACRLDVTSEESIKKAVDFVKRKYGKIDVLVNVVGILCRKSFFQATKQDFEKSFSINVTGMFLVSQAIAELMRADQGGSIINISSMNGKMAAENRVVYGATKAAVNLLTKSMALELGPFGINVNAVAPGVVDSKMARVRLNTPELIKQYENSIPLNRLADPTDVAHCVVFLASPYAKYISGEIILVDGALCTRMSLPRKFDFGQE
ncbi:MAG: SDR family oxidoreductase [Deltaproteobacteria bacterium]|nr:SDR family oxidoreductase [Deltaproteobacteria bacterium]